jgi:uncharacterized phage protein (TIGR02218 family)
MKVEVYKFTSASERWLFTSAGCDQVYLGETYRAVPIGRDKIEMTENVHKSPLAISAPRDNDLVSCYCGVDRPESTVVLTIFEIDGGGIGSMIWKGRVASVNLTGSKAKVTLESIFTSIGRPGLRAVYQLSCRHALYKTSADGTKGCRLLPDSYVVNANVTDYDGQTLTVSGLGGYADGWFTAGYLVQAGIRYRMILSHIGDQIGIDRVLAHTGAIKIYPGCNHLMTDCKNKFDNLDNFGGFPWIPGQTPFEGLGSLGVSGRAL